MLGLEPLGLAQVALQPRVRLLADRAGVEQDQVRAVAGGGLGVAQGLEHALHALGVVLVHLAPEGGQVVAGHRGRIPPALASLRSCVGLAAPRTATMTRRYRSPRRPRGRDARRRRGRSGGRLRHPRTGSRHAACRRPPRRQPAAGPGPAGARAGGDGARHAAGGAERRRPADRHGRQPARDPDRPPLRRHRHQARPRDRPLRRHRPRGRPPGHPGRLVRRGAPPGHRAGGHVLPLVAGQDDPAHAGGVPAPLPPVPRALPVGALVLDLERGQLHRPAHLTRPGPHRALLPDRPPGVLGRALRGPRPATSAPTGARGPIAGWRRSSAASARARTAGACPPTWT